jgi:hypothetical protein
VFAAIDKHCLDFGFGYCCASDKSPVDADVIAILTAIGRAENCDSLLDCVRRFGASEAVVGKKVMEAVALHVVGPILLIEAKAPPKNDAAEFLPMPSHVTPPRLPITTASGRK